MRGEASADGIACIAFHGLLRGMKAVLAQRRKPTCPRHELAPAAPVAFDPALVRVLANMVLQIHSEVRHVY